MPNVIDDDGTPFDAAVDVLVIGAGAAGSVAALRARERDRSVLLVERDALPRGSTSLSAGLIPAPATRFQKAAGIDDSVAQFAADILRKAKNQPNPRAVEVVARSVGPAVEWLAEAHGLPFSVITNFNYPGHSAFRMHGLPSRSGAELMDRLSVAVEAAGIDVLTKATAVTLIRRGPRAISGVVVQRGDGSRERIGCGSLVLACNGYGGNPALVAAHIREMEGARYFGHPGNQGDALLWGDGLGAATSHLSGYQGHGSVAQPHAILITWATITEGGFQVNTAGDRFANEARGYSEAAAAVIAEPGATVWTIFDRRIADIARQFDDFRTAEAQGAVITAETMEDLANKIHAPQLTKTAREVTELKKTGGVDRFGRSWSSVAELNAPFAAVRVTGALFHTQGGLVVDDTARVISRDGRSFENLFAVGGAAAGVSGDSASGYLSGNGLLTAVAYGFLAGAAA